jgi:predicted O-linked N-acetylglucosamine transferase (SPINDLY family)
MIQNGSDTLLTYEELLLEAENQNLIVKEKPLRNNDGRILGNRIAIRSNMLNSKRACALAEEIGHYHTTTGNILDQSKVENRKQELHARVWAYNKQIGLSGIIKAYQYGCRNQAEIADYLDVTETFLSDAIKTYQAKYGLFATLDNYIIYFEPLGVLEMYK